MRQGGCFPGTPSSSSARLREIAPSWGLALPGGTTKKARLLARPRLERFGRQSERDVVVFLIFIGRSRGRALRRAGALGRAGLLLRAFGITAAAVSAAAFGTEKLEGFTDDLQLAALLAGGLVIPSVEAQAAF